MVGFDEDLEERIRLKKELDAANAAGKTLKQFREDKQYMQDIADIEADNKAYEAEEAAEVQASEFAPVEKKTESEAARLAGEEGLRQAKILGEGGVPEKRDTGTYTALDDASAAQQKQKIEDEAGPQFTNYETPKYEEAKESGSGSGFMDKLWEKFPTFKPQAEVEAGLLEKEKLRGLKDEWQIDPNIQDEIIKRETMATGSDIEGKDNEGFMPESPEALAAAGEQSDFQRDENDPAVKQMAEVQKDQKLREEMLPASLGKKKKAMLKEELGNYYIGPGGYAINLDKVDASLKREGNFRLLQYIPDHAKPYFLAKWGYLDPEDVKGMPESPEYNLEEMKGIQAIALQKSKNKSNEKIVDKNIDGQKVLADKKYTSLESINAANNTLKGRLEDRKIDLGELELDASLFMHGDKLDMEQYIADNKLDLSREELQQLDKHFTKKLSFEYSQMFTNDDYRNRVVDQSDAQFNRKFARLDKQDQEAMIMAEFNRAQKTVDMYIEAGQFESAVLASAGMPTRLVGFNYKNYFKNKAKTSGTDPIFTAAMGMSDNLQGYMASSGKDVKKLRDEYYNRKDALVSKLMKESDPLSGEASFMDTQMGAMNIVQFDSLPAKSVKTTEGKTITAGKDEYNNNRMQYRSAMRIKIFDQMMKKDPVYGQLHNNINNARTHYQTTGSLDTFGGGGGSKTVPKTVPKKAPKEVPKEVPKVEGVKTKIQEQVEQELAAASATFKNELARGDQEYVQKFASWFRSPSSKIEALKVGKKDLGFELRKNKRGLWKDHKMDLEAIDKIVDQPKKLVEFLKSNMRWFKKLSPEAKFYVAQQDANFNSGIDK